MTLDRWARPAQWAAVVLGALLRLRQYLHARPLWLDEAMLVNNILGRPFLGLLAPLDSDQSAPIPFLWGVKLAALAGGVDVRVLRLLPFLGGLLLLLIVLAIARRILTPWEAAFAVLATALSPMLIYYSNEVKPYGLDALGSTVVMLLALRVAEAPERRDRWLVLLLAGVGVSVASSAAPMVLAGVGLALLVDGGVRRAPQSATWLAALAAGWGLVFGVAYLTVYRASADSAYLQRYWVPLFLSPALPGLAGKVHHAMGDMVVEALLSVGGAWRWQVGFYLHLFMVAGAWALARRWGARLPALLVSPFVIAVLFSALRRYPVAPRLMLFSMPAGLLLLAAGFTAFARLFPARFSRPAGALLALALLGLPALDAAREFREPSERNVLPPLVRRFEAEHAPGAPVYLYGRAVPNWVFYTTDWAAPDTGRVHRLSELIGSTGPAFRHAGSRGHAVRDEGDALVYRYRDWVELVGVPTGTGPDSLGINGEAPDSGWAANEARRLRATGSPEAWVVLSSFMPGLPATLDSAIVLTGGRRTLTLEGSGSMLARYEYGPAAPR